jgi:hypothetical protein
MRGVFLLLLGLLTAGGARAVVAMTHDQISSAAIVASQGSVELSASLGGSPFASLTAPGILVLQGFWFPRHGFSAAEEQVGAMAFALGQNWPNPFKPATVIPYAVAEAGGSSTPTQMEIYDVDGRLVTRLVDANLPAGTYRAEWNGCDAFGRPVAAGVYYCRLQSGRQEATKTLILLR